MVTPEKIAIVGTSGHGLAAFEAAKRQGLQVVGFLDSFKEPGTPLEGLKILGHPDNVDQLMNEFGFTGVFLGVSNNYTRRTIWEDLRAKAPELMLACVIHPSAVVASNAKIGPGSLLMAGAIVNPGCVVGENCIVNTNAALDHNSELKSHSSLLPGVTTGGDVVVGECSCICIGAILSHRVHIGNHTVVGAGSVVLHDLPGCSLAYGSPARVVRRRDPEERHF